MVKTETKTICHPLKLRILEEGNLKYFNLIVVRYCDFYIVR